MATIVELLVILGSSFGLGLIPFAGPSNLLVAYNLALGLGYTDSLSLFAVGFFVALGVALAKGIHYIVTFFISKHLNEKTQKRLDADAIKVRKWAFLLLFVAAVTPIPDEPIVIPLGLMKYSPVKFFGAYFFGKLIITVAGAFLGSWIGGTISEWLSFEASIILSIILTIIITVVLLKVDVGKLARQILRKLGRNVPEPAPSDAEEKSK